MRWRWSTFIFVALCFLAPSFALAHHSITAEFDPSKVIVLKGTITAVDWVNPHVYLHLDVTDENGKTANWAFETYPPAVLKRGGLNRETFKEGQVVSIDAFAPKDGTKNLAYLKHITFADGHSVEIWIGDPGQYK
jgi:hypothetical protein